MDFTFFDWFFGHMSGIANLLSSYKVFGVPLLAVFVGFVIMSIFASVFWKGARG